MNYIRMIIITVLIFLTVNPAFSATAIELMNEGKMLLYKGDIYEGVRVLEEASRMDDQNPYIKLTLAKGYSWSNKWDKAKSLYNEIVNTSQPEDQIYWEAKFGIAQITSWEKKYDEAIILYREILTSYKKIPKQFKLDIGLAIGDIYSWKMENDKAHEQFSRLLAENPGDTVILNRIAKIYLWQGEHQQSREYTEKVLAIDSKDAESSERKRILDQIKPFTVTLGYHYIYYDTKNNKDENVQVHNLMQGLDWQYSNPLAIFLSINEIRQNSIESKDPEEASAWNNDVNLRAGSTYRVNNLTYVTAAADYALNSKIYPDFSGELSASRKLSQIIDVEGLYKYTYDTIDSAQTIDNKQYHLLSAGLVLYYNPEIYNKIQFFVESDGKDLFYSALIQQYLTINPENVFQFYLFLSQGRTYLTFSDTTILMDTTTYSASLLYTHYFTSSFGLEFSTGLMRSVGNYANYQAGINGIIKW